MDPKSDNFETLCRLLRFKRHEQPPPGYFEALSGQIIRRLRAGEEAGQTAAWERLAWDAPWLQRFWEALAGKPVLAGGLGFAVCALLLSGVVYSHRIEVTPLAVAPVEDASPASLLAAFPPLVFNQPLDGAADLASTNPIVRLKPPGSLFDALNLRVQSLEVQPASGAQPRGN